MCKMTNTTGTATPTTAMTTTTDMIGASTTHKTNEKHVQFGPTPPRVYALEAVPIDDRPALWYSGDELYQLYQADKKQAQTHALNERQTETTLRGLEDDRALNFLEQPPSTNTSKASNSNSHHQSSPTTKATSTTTTSRIQSYARDVLGMYQYGKMEYGSDFDPEMLMQFATSRSQPDREFALKMGQRDHNDCSEI